ncbi:MAG: site-specific DNA-methyltransferase, partial [Patescibacteria group bacterium]
TGQWDWQKLADFDMSLLLDVGFDDQDLSRIWDDMLQSEDDDFNLDEELAAIETPKTKPGDMYQLGVHRLICGDSTDPAVVKRLCGEDRPDMIYTDIPYNISLDYSGGVGGKASYGGTYDDKKTDEEYADFVRKIIGNALTVAKDDCHCFLWCDQSYVWLLQQLYRELGVKYKRTCLWIKNVANATPKTAFNKVYEPVVYGIRGGPYLSEKQMNLTEVLNKEVSTGNRAIDDILDYLDIWLVKRLPGNEYAHATQKPPTLHEKPLRRCTRVGDIVLDLTAGSGSTLISCEQMKRKALLCEIEPRFCDLIVKRYEELTGVPASLLNNE